MLKRLFYFFLVSGAMVSILYGEVLLRNGSFETSSPLSGWEIIAYGAKPVVSGDMEQKKNGRQSARIFSHDTTDTAVAQEVEVVPGKTYCLTGWIRTLDLTPYDSPVFGTMIVQLPGGGGNIAYGQNHGGTTDWIKEMIFFVGPECGRVRLSLFFVGYGKGTGTVWFDDVRLGVRDELSGTVRVKREQLCKGQINPFQYGQFVEPFCDCGIGMWSEKLSNTGFEEIVPFHDDIVFRKQKDFQYRPWYPTGAVQRGSYFLDKQSPYNGNSSQCIAVKNGESCTLGIAQDGIAVNKGEKYNLSVYLRQMRISGEVRLFLHEGQTVLAEAVFKPDLNWKKYTAKLIPSADAVNATLEIEYVGPGTLWVDLISLMPEDTVFGWRKDVVEALEALNPGIIRWGGIAVEHVSWKNLVGDPDKRKPWADPWWGGMHPPAAGVEEFVKLCQAIHVEPMICARITDSTASDAASEVEYFNGAVDTPMGALRAKNGHPEPYGVKYWQVGNEQDGAEYTRKLKPFCEAMRRADPTIKLLSSFPNPDMVKEAASVLDYICPHHYKDLTGCSGEFSRLEWWIQQYGGGRPLKIAVTEWNTTGGDWGLPRGSLWTLDNALTCAIYRNIMHHHADTVAISNRSDLVNSFCTGNIQTDHYRLFKTPTYYTDQLYATMAGSVSLQYSIEGDVMYNEVSATFDSEKNSLTLFFVNPLRLSRTIRFDFSDWNGCQEKVLVQILQDTKHSNQRDVNNSFEDPHRVGIVKSSVMLQNNQFFYSIPELSLSVFRIQLEEK